MFEKLSNQEPLFPYMVAHLVSLQLLTSTESSKNADMFYHWRGKGTIPYFSLRFSQRIEDEILAVWNSALELWEIPRQSLPTLFNQTWLDNTTLSDAFSMAYQVADELGKFSEEFDVSLIGMASLYRHAQQAYELSCTAPYITPTAVQERERREAELRLQAANQQKSEAAEQLVDTIQQVLETRQPTVITKDTTFKGKGGSTYNIKAGSVIGDMDPKNAHASNMVFSQTRIVSEKSTPPPSPGSTGRVHNYSGQQGAVGPNARSEGNTYNVVKDGVVTSTRKD